MHVRKKICDCGCQLVKKRGRLPGSSSGRPVGTTAEAGFNTSSGHPTANVEIKMNVPIGRPVLDVNVEMNVPVGHPIGTTREAGSNTYINWISHS